MTKWLAGKINLWHNGWMTLTHQSLSQLYHNHLASPHPAKSDGSVVAGAKIRDQLLLGRDVFLDQQENWAEFFHAWDNTPERVYIWSDLHVSHKNICAYAGRPFDSMYRMNEVLLQNTSHLTPDDVLLFLGDVSFDTPENTELWLSQINCPQFLVLGNHDVDRKWKFSFNRKTFRGVTDCLHLMHGDTQALLTHYPLGKSTIPKDALNVHGHIHQNLLDGPYINVSVEHLNYGPKKLVDLLNNPTPSIAPRNKM